MSWKNVYMHRFIDTEFKVEDVRACIKVIVTELNDIGEKIKLNKTVKSDDNKISLPNYDIAYNVEAERIIFTLQTIDSSKSVLKKVSITNNKEFITISGIKTNGDSVIDFMNFDLCKSIDMAMESLLKE